MKRVGLLLLATFVGGVAEAALDFAECDRRVLEEPEEAGSYGCFIDAGNLAQDMAGAERRLQALLDVRPEQYWARYFLGMAVTEQGDTDRGLPMMVESAEAMEADDEPAGAAQARVKVALFQTNLRLYDDARAHLKRAEVLANQSEDAAVLARVLVQFGWTELRSGDYTAAALHMRRAEALVFPEGDARAQEETLGGRGAVAWLTGRFAEAARIYERQAVLLEEADRPYELAIARTNQLGVSSSLADRGEIAMDEYERIARFALATAEAANNPRSACRAESALADILTGEESRKYALAAIDSARRSGDQLTIRGTLRQVAPLLARLDPTHVDEALALLEEAKPAPFGNPDERIRQLIMTASVWRFAGEREQVVEAYEALFDAAERLRDVQRDDLARAGALAMVVPNYRQLAAHLLELDASDDRNVEQAFGTLERMRSRVLLDRLDANGVTTAIAPEGELADRRTELIDAIEAVQRSLASADGDASQRQEWLRQLEGLEIEELDVRARLASSDPRFGQLRVPEFPDIREIQQRLTADQALLSFALGRSTAGGSWVVVIDADGARAHRLADVDELRRQAAFLVGLLERRDGSEAAAARRLGESLFEEALGGLDASVHRLVVVPDDLMWSLPLGALRVEESGPDPLARYFEISLAPSATLWKRWVDGDVSDPVVPVLALADPQIASDDGDDAAVRDWALERGVPLGRLPHAQDEARALTRRLGGGSRLLLGGEATEAALKAETLGDYGVLHLAAHAVVDDARPDRSAIMLAAGSPDEDGLLQPREIAELDLEGRVVLLTACRSASGSLLQGEGPLSLAHAFFEAGAHSVVGSLWPLRDDEAAHLIGAFSRHLARGQTLSAALASARRDMIAEGRPVASWAGLVLIGTGDRTPVPGGRAPTRGPMVWLLTVAFMLGAAGLLLRQLFRGKKIPQG